MTDDEALAHAELAAKAWGGVTTSPRLIRNRENAVFEVWLKDAGHAALRLHRIGYQTTPSITAELEWTEALSTIGFRCPRPLRTVDGALTTEPAFGPITSAVAWIDADPIGENDVPFVGSVDAHCALYRDVGRTIRALHDATAKLELGEITRPRWDLDGLLGEMPLWGRFWENPSLSPREAALLQDARRAAVEQLRRLDGQVQLIHADLLQENILVDKSGLWLIDFDDSGVGYPGYDLGTALIQHAEATHLDALSDALLEGYGADAAMADALDLFIMLRSMASCGWIMSRKPADDPGQRFYAERALLCASRYIQTTTSISS